MCGGLSHVGASTPLPIAAIVNAIYLQVDAPFQLSTWHVFKLLVNKLRRHHHSLSAYILYAVPPRPPSRFLLMSLDSLL